MDPESAYEFGPFRLDPHRRVLWRGGELVPLTPKALALLEALVEQGGEVVPKADLLARVWPDTVVEEANLGVTVAALRKALGNQPDGRSYIQTVPRRGYRFDASVRRPVSSSRIALGVLPFRSLGPVPEPHLGLGMADALIRRLTASEELLVRPTGAVMAHARESWTPEQAAEALGVDAVVDGTLQRDRGRVRLSVQLVPRGGRVKPWAESFDADYTDIFSVQDAVADRVARALRARLESPAKARPAPGRRPVVEAYEAYLRGRYLWTRLDPAGVVQAASCFVEAAALDPAYAAPHAGLADAHVLSAFAGLVEPMEAWRQAGECVARALELDPTLPEAHVSAGFVALFRDWDWAGARRALEQALALAPGAPAIQMWNGLLLAAGGDAEGARREIARAREADPTSVFASAIQAVVHEITGEHERQIEVARLAVELWPDRFLAHWGLGVACVLGGRGAEGIAALRRAVELTGGSPALRGVLAWALAATGLAGEARSLLAELEPSALSPYRRAAVLLALGERDAALAQLESAAAARDPWIVFLGVDPALAGLRGEARHDALLARIHASSGPRG